MGAHRFQAPSSSSKYFATPAYLKELEPGTFQLFRSIEEEQLDPSTGKLIREKVRDLPIGPPLREAKDGEQVILRSFHPVTKRELILTFL
jgi:hypothetical protein